MHMLHEKADTQRTKIYTSAANSDVYRQTAKNVSDIVRNIPSYQSLLLAVFTIFIQFKYYELMLNCLILSVSRITYFLNQLDILIGNFPRPDRRWIKS
jgi:hypothetical protein